jgi:hypothetical protein
MRMNVESISMDNISVDYKENEKDMNWLCKGCQWFECWKGAYY